MELIFEVEVNLSVCTVKWVEVEKEVRRVMGGEGGEKEEGVEGNKTKKKKKNFFPHFIAAINKAG